MAVLIASNLRKELSGDPLFDGVSFKVERRDRLALSGPNGAGKTTLLRALSGEVSLQGGDLALRRPALRRRLVQGRAPRPPRTLRPERRRQDDAAACALGRGVAPGRRARVGEG